MHISGFSTNTRSFSGRAFVALALAAAGGDPFPTANTSAMRGDWPGGPTVRRPLCPCWPTDLNYVGSVKDWRTLIRPLYLSAGTDALVTPTSFVLLCANAEGRGPDECPRYFRRRRR